MNRLLHLLKNPPNRPRTYLLTYAWLQFLYLSLSSGRLFQKLFSGQPFQNLRDHEIITLAFLLASVLYILRQAHAHIVMIALLAACLLYTLIEPLTSSFTRYHSHDLYAAATYAFLLLLWLVPFLFERKLTTKAPSTKAPSEQLPHASQET